VLSKRVAALRCGLDQASWDGDGTTRCKNALLSIPFAGDDTRAGRPLPFDVGLAHELYQSLLGPDEDAIRGKRLIIVPSGPLSSLPFHVLVTKPQAEHIHGNATAYADAGWLAKRHAITVLPSVSSLKALREFARTSKATQAFIGFGNPLLLGPDGRDRSAWERQDCRRPAGSVQVARRSIRSALPKFFRNGLANGEEIRAQYPLPETADELCAVAVSMGAPESTIYLGEKATERVIKTLSNNGTLASARIVHFATHGLLAGETEALAATKAEPALILTPPLRTALVWRALRLCSGVQFSGWQVLLDRRSSSWSNWIQRKLVDHICSRIIYSYRWSSRSHDNWCCRWQYGSAMAVQSNGICRRS
jgi:hypothetical protein